MVANYVILAEQMVQCYIQSQLGKFFKQATRDFYICKVRLYKYGLVGDIACSHKQVTTQIYQ